MAGDKGKRILVNLSSSSDDDNSDYDDVTSSSSGDDCDFIDDTDLPISDDDEEEIDDDESDDSCENGDDVDRVLRFLQEKRDLQELSLKACKSYLRRHRLRVSGTKDVCVQRLLEHWRIKDGKAEVFYPRSSFNINCKGDVCRGDIVLFTQKVNGSFDKVTRNGKLLGKRTIAGRVVKESYGAAKQQHTFTVEVLWSKGVKKLPLLFPLLVKGRNLYRLNTYRQPWKNEGERRNVLGEKHRRGTAARLKRDKRKNAWSSSKGVKSQKVVHGPRLCKMSCSKVGKDFGRDQGISTSKHSTTNSNRQQHTLKQGAVKQTANAKISKPYKKHQNITLRTHHNASSKNQNPLGRSHYGSMPYETVVADFQREFTYCGPMLKPTTQFTGSCNHHSLYFQSPRMAPENNLHYLPSGIGIEQHHYGLFRCSVQGCLSSGSEMCVIGACWRCCRKGGLQCNVHR